MKLTVSESLSTSGFLKQPMLSSQYILAIAGHLRSICLTKLHGVSHINKVGGYLRDKYRLVASGTGSCSVSNLEPTVDYKKTQK